MFRRLIALAAASCCFRPNWPLADEQTKGKLSIWLGYPETLDAFKLGQVEFKKKYPNVEVEILTFELREFEAKLAVSVPAGSGPDILALHDFISRAITRAARSSTCRPISRRTSTTRRSSTRRSRNRDREGKPWGVPWWSGRNGLFYNIDHLRAAGLSEPPKTYEEVWKYAEKLTQKGAKGELTRAGISLRLTGPSGGTQKFGYFYYQLAGEQMFEPGRSPAPCGSPSQKTSMRRRACWSITSITCMAPKKLTTGRSSMTRRASRPARPRCSCAKAG